MIQFNTPEWFFLIPLLLAAGWKYRRLRLASPCASFCRAACCWPWLSLPLTGAAKTWTCGCWWTNQIPRREFRQQGQRKSRLFWNGTNMPGTASDWWISRNPPCSGDAETRLCRGNRRNGHGTGPGLYHGPDVPEPDEPHPDVDGRLAHHAAGPGGGTAHPVPDSGGLPPVRHLPGSGPSA